MNAEERQGLHQALEMLIARLRTARPTPDHWVGHLASSALSTGTSILALHMVDVHSGRSRTEPSMLVRRGMQWLVDHQNVDGGWGDTVRSRSNISTTAIVWAALSFVGDRQNTCTAAVEKATTWLRVAAGDTTPTALRAAILKRYGKDRTFSVPILTVLALCGKLGSDPTRAWRLVPQLPFELAALPHTWFHRLRLPVVSYALPALIAIGQVRHRHAPSRNPLTRRVRDAAGARTRTILRAMQPQSGGYLEASPLTSFVVMSLAAAGHATHAVAQSGVRFLADTVRDDGSWPIDSDLSTWVTTLSSIALARSGALSVEERMAIRRWLGEQQSRTEHPFTHAAPGAWTWTPLSGGVPDADDTAGALIALNDLGEADVEIASAGTRWLMGVQNRDGGIPTFCRGWGALPFDRSTPELTAHALRAWSAWFPRVEPRLQTDLRLASDRAIAYLERSQRPDGSWVPLWFGNEAAPGEDNPVYGTARVLLGLQSSLAATDSRAGSCAARGARWLIDAQNVDGGFGGARGVVSSVEETGVALSALARLAGAFSPSSAGHGLEGETGATSIGVTNDELARALQAGVRWLVDACREGDPLPSPIGLYFARLWYFEALYPTIFAVEGLSAVWDICEISRRKSFSAD